MPWMSLTRGRCSSRAKRSTSFQPTRWRGPSSPRKVLFVIVFLEITVFLEIAVLKTAVLKTAVLKIVVLKIVGLKTAALKRAGRSRDAWTPKASFDVRCSLKRQRGGLKP